MILSLDLECAYISVDSLSGLGLETGLRGRWGLGTWSPGRPQDIFQGGIRGLGTRVPTGVQGGPGEGLGQSPQKPTTGCENVQRIIYKRCLFMHLQCYIHIGLAPKYVSDCVSTVSAASGR